MRRLKNRLDYYHFNQLSLPVLHNQETITIDNKIQYIYIYIRINLWTKKPKKKETTSNHVASEQFHQCEND